MYPKEIIHELFSTVKKFVLEAGGDGDGWIVSENYKSYAEMFRKFYEDGPSLGFKNMSVSDGAVIFSVGQESISFVDKRERLPEWAGDIVVEIH